LLGVLLLLATDPFARLGCFADTTSPDIAVATNTKTADDSILIFDFRNTPRIEKVRNDYIMFLLFEFTKKASAILLSKQYNAVRQSNN
jgi:hypothetical protein